MFVQYFGLCLITFVLLVFLYVMIRTPKVTAGLLGFCALLVFAGLALIISDRITELTIRGIGTIKAASAQATADATVIGQLKTRVENQSATVDAVAKQASDAITLSKQAANQSEIAKAKLDDLNASIENAKALLASLQSDADFINTIEQAQNDDRSAFDKLKLIAADVKSPYSARASQAWNVVYESHNGPMSQSGFSIPWKDGVDPSKFSMDELQAIYIHSQAVLKPALLEYISKRTDIPTLAKLDFYIIVMKTDASITAAEYAGRYFTAATNQQIKPLAVDYLTKWWDSHRADYVGR